MTKSKKAVLLVLPLLFLAGVASFLFFYNQEGFTGNRIKNPDAYLLDIERMNGTDLHTLELHEGDVLQIQFETVKGSLYMEIKAPDGTTIYRGDCGRIRHHGLSGRGEMASHVSRHRGDIARDAFAVEVRRWESLHRRSH